LLGDVIVMLITKATAKDAEAIAQNNVDLRLETENISIDFDLVLKGVQALINNRERGFYLVAKEQDAVIGQLMVTYEWSDWRNQDIWWLHRIFVQKSSRHTGVFTRLFEKIRLQARKNNVYALRLYLHELSNEVGVTYKKLGMTSSPFSIYSIRV